MQTNGKEISSREFPLVSVIMPVRNEAAYIKRSLNAVLGQSYPQEKLEVIIADGISTDDTRKIIAELAQTSAIPIKIVENSGKIAPTGLNTAIRHAGGEIIVRVDGHCEIHSDYVQNCVRYLAADEAEGVGGPLETIGETFAAQAIALAMSSGFGVGGSAFRTVRNRKLYVDTVAFPGYTRKIIEEVGFFNEELVRNQDDEYNYRLRNLGGRILLAPDIRAKYYSRGTLTSLWKQYFQYGFWKVRVMQIHPRQMSLRQFIPAVFVLSLVLSILTALFLTSFGWIIFAGISGLYLFANLFSSIKLAVQSGFQYLFILPICFSILHFSYGLGFLIGLFYFINRWNEKH